MTSHAMRPVAIFRFSPTEGPAYLADWLGQRRIASTLVALDAGVAVPADPRAFAGIALMGGPMGANDALPWIESTCRLLRAAVGERVPVLGHCLGGQLFAKALGAKVTRARRPRGSAVARGSRDSSGTTTLSPCLRTQGPC